MSDLRKWKALVENASNLTEDPVQDADYTDHEVSMAKSQMLSSMKSINRIAKHLATKSEGEGLEGWTASKLTMAEDYLQVVADYFDGKEINESKRWKQTSMSPEAATKEYGKDNVRVKKGALRNGDDMIEVFVEGFKIRESLNEGKTVAVKFYDEFDTGYVVHIGDNTLSLNGAEVNKNFQWDRPKGHAFSTAESYVSKWMYKMAKDWNDVHAYLKRARDTGNEQTLLTAVQKTFKTASMQPKIAEGYKVLPPMDKEKYQARDGLEGPFSTLSGKVVYYDPKAGKYYDPDTDMYMSYDEFRRYDDDYKGMKEAEGEENHYMCVHAKKGTTKCTAKTSYEAAQKAAKLWNMKSTAGIDAHLMTDESLEEDTVKYEDHYDSRVVLTVEKDKLLINGNLASQYDWKSSAKDIISDKFYARARSWEEVHGYLVRFLDNPKGLQAAVRQVFNTNDEGIQVNETVMFSEAQFDEAAGEKDACYHKVKSRYKVWPSAYASGALVKCRKVGAKNWGNSKK